MTAHPPQKRPSAAALLDRLLACSNDAEADALFEDLLASYKSGELARAIRPRLGRLAEPGGEHLLRLVDAVAQDTLYQALAEALLDQPELPIERSLLALGVLQEAELLEAFPELVDRLGEWAEASDPETALNELAEQLESSPQDLWSSLHTLQTVEPDLRADMLRSLAASQSVPGPGLVAFFRLLAHCPEPLTRDAALDALALLEREGESDLTRAAWATLAADHAERQVTALARQRLGNDAEAAIARWAGPDRAVPQIAHSLVTGVDGEGQALIVLVAEQGGATAGASFFCDIEQGITEVIGEWPVAENTVQAILDGVAQQRQGNVVRDTHRLAIALLSSAAHRCGPATSPAVRLWIERTAGPRFRGMPLPEWLDEEPPDIRSPALRHDAEAIFDACPEWIDRSELTDELAQELALREPGRSPDPQRDAAIYRYYYEHRLAQRLDRYRRMLIWMAAFWQAQGRAELVPFALAFARDLAEPSVALPTHPFLETLITRSLKAMTDD